VPTLEPGHQPVGLGLGNPGGADGGREHPSIRSGEAGVGRTPGTDPGHS
jgi:hypothetical protein